MEQQPLTPDQLCELEIPVPQVQVSGTHYIEAATKMATAQAPLLANVCAERDAYALYAQQVAQKSAAQTERIKEQATEIEALKAKIVELTPAPTVEEQIEDMVDILEGRVEQPSYRLSDLSHLAPPPIPYTLKSAEDLVAAKNGAGA